jgi:hypothetical protein
MQTFSFSAWERICKDLEFAKIFIGGVNVVLAEGFKLVDESAYLRRDYNELDPFDSAEWPVALVGKTSPKGGRIDNDIVAREISSLGYGDTRAAVSFLCQANLWGHRACNYEFYAALPMFASISKIQVTKASRKIQVSLKHHSKLPSLKVMASFFGRNSRGDMVLKKNSEPISLPRVRHGEVIANVDVEVEKPDLADDDEIRAKLIHRKLGEVDQCSGIVRHFLPAEDANILFEALKAFCPETQLRELLTEPHSEKARKLDPSAGFELRVAWLLSLFGFSTIILGEYERLVEHTTKVEYGTVDILAYSQEQELLLLVACTIGPPKEQDFTNLLNILGILQRRVLNRSSARILPVIFAAADHLKPYEERQGVMAVPLVGRKGTQDLLELLKLRREEIFFRYLCNPLFNELRVPSVTP